jgi:L-ectoine synthase
MRIVKIHDLVNTNRDVKFTGGNSIRPVLESDGLGFAMMKTIIPKGGPHFWHYDKHLEACYCIQGHGVLTNVWTGEHFDIRPDTVYIQDEHEEHTFEALKDTILISIFNPPLKGNEKHDENGNYGA